MAEQMSVSSQEHGLVRVFAVDLPAEDIAAFKERTLSGDQERWPLRSALGATYLDEDFIELFDVADLEELGLSGYMAQGLGIAADEITEARRQLDTVEGYVLIVLSKAFDGVKQTLTPRRPLRWIGTFKEEGAGVQFKPLQSEAAKGSVSDTPNAKTKNPHLMVMAAILALPILITLIALIVWLIAW
ncbi:hypothetical protein [Cognatishimia maritima]|uniref:Uncharacterized protein n=1 Tax=Cognatishimia maritima TaxID=870908 RepID=A0A1M5RPL2_9RHOB|nr:hypothetical protein [Cognatishimia maritima]SHH28204.1 hypothetical protein SAMN04488044_2258 [Cognatishimia maritima]